MSTPAGPPLPYSASSTTPATIVGSAKGRSISALTMRLPGNSSRTSTQAISVPNSALIETTIAETISVSFSAATASGLETDCQKAEGPPLAALAKSADSGSRTSTDRYTPSSPRPSALPPLPAQAPAGR